MSETTPIGLPEAARSLGVSIRALREAIRAGKIPGPTRITATASFTADWLNGAEKALEADPRLFSSLLVQKVPPFARYEGTSAWRKYRARVREYNKFHRAA